ncbi:MAG TPA: protein kinase [Pseudonocardiaceae bacterium]
MSTSPRLVAGRYRLDQQIGTGAMGVVWRAHDERLDRGVALKELLVQPGLAEAEEETARARAMREGRIAARLHHPHAISVYDVAVDRGTGLGDEMVPWLVMEYLPSRSLATVLAEQGTLAPHEVAGIGQQVAGALAAAHDAGIVHRDIKPGNVLLGWDGTVKITDFGISRASWDTTLTRTGVLSGTPAYFAPEVARGELPGPASDVFSLGSMLYVAVEGEPPFGLDDNTLALLRTVAEGAVRPPERAGPLSPILMRLLADDPAARPSMSDAAAALGMVTAGGPGSSPSATPLLARPPRPRAPAPAAVMPTAVDLPASPPHAAARMSTGGGLAGGPIPWWRRPAVLFGIAGCLLVLAVVLTVRSPAPTTDRDQLAASSNSQTPGARAVPAPVQVPTPRTLPPQSQQQSQQQPGQPKTQQPQPEQLQPEQLEQTVRTYYGLLPEDTAGAWQYLGTGEQAQGFEHYTNFWNGINRISIRGPLSIRGNTVLVSLRFVPADRKPTVERYQLTMGRAPDGRILIESATRVAGAVLAAGQPGG